MGYRSDLASVHQHIAQSVSGTLSEAMACDVSGEVISVSDSSWGEFIASLPETSFVWRYVTWERWDEEKAVVAGKRGAAFFDFDMPLVAGLLRVGEIGDWPIVVGDENYLKVAPTMRLFIEDLETAWGSVAGAGRRCITDIALMTHPRSIRSDVPDDAVVVARIAMTWDGGSGILSFCYPPAFMDAVLPSYGKGG